MSGAEAIAGLTTDELPPELRQFADEESEERTKPDDTPKGDESTAEVKEETRAEVDPLVAKAQSGGWTDKEAWVEAGKDPDLWVDAKEFVSRTPLYEKNRELKKALKAEQERSQRVAEYAARVAETTRNKVLAELEEAKIQAVSIGDVPGYQEIEKQIEQARKDIPAVDQVSEPAAPEIPASVKDFSERNAKWFEKDKPMTIFMVETTKEYTAAGKPLEEALKLAEADVKREFAHKFINPNKERPGAVGSSNKEERPNTVTHADLTGEQRSVWSALKKTGMKFDEFVAGLKAQGEFK